MDLPTLKSHLSLQAVLDHYGLTPDRNSRLHCPWHDDKTPSLQIYLKTDTWTCFSTACEAGSGDQIDFIMRYEGISKHEAIMKAKTLIGQGIIPGSASGKGSTTAEKSTTDYPKLFTQFKRNFKNGRAVDYLAERGLDRRQIEVGYNGQGWRWLKHCLVFALRDGSGEIVSFYGRSVYPGSSTGTGSADAKHYYLKNRRGLYPSYPDPKTRTLIITESVIDAATLLQGETIRSQYGILAMYGTQGLTQEHQNAIRALKDLQEIVLFFDGDEAGRQAVEKWTPVLRELQPTTTISYVNTPEGEDVNSLHVSHEAGILKQLIDQRIELPKDETLLFSTDTSTESASTEEKKDAERDTKGRFVKQTDPFDTSNPKNLCYRGKAATYYIKGGLKNGLDTMKVSLQVVTAYGDDYRGKVDLYDYKQVDAFAKVAGEKLGLNTDEIAQDLAALAGRLEDHRASKNQEDEVKEQVTVAPEVSMKCKAFLKRNGLLQEINKLIGRAGIVGEEKNRLFLYVIASSYKMEDTLHALVQGSSGSGKTHLITKLAGLMPDEDVITLTRITDSSLYNYGMYDLQNKIIVIEDLDGLREEALLALRELMSRGLLASSTSVKDDSGNIRSQVRTVYGPITSLSATTKGETYEDNMSRSFLVAVDESDEQTYRVIDYQNRVATGKIVKQDQKKIKTFLQNCMRLIQPLEVVNPYADKIKLPKEAHKIRRLNELFQAFVRQVTLLNQYQRKKDGRGRLVTEKEDMEVACEIMFESIVLKVDELDGSLRQFFEDLKTWLKKKDQEFIQRDVRQALRISKTQLHRYTQDLIELEYIQQAGGSPNRGYTYKISYWDNIERLRSRIRTDLTTQLSAL